MKIISFFIIVFLCNLAHAAEPDSATLLKMSDQGRGGGDLAGLSWQVEMHSTGGNNDNAVDQTLILLSLDQSSLAEIISPANLKGTKILQVDRNMWFYKPSLKKPVAISPRQRLTGQASTGDVAGTNYAKDYDATFLREEEVDQESCVVLDLHAKTNQSTYDHIVYWISKKRGLAVQADFLTISGKKIKSAKFEYKNQLTVRGRNTAFVSRMSIQDALTDAKTDLLYSSVKIRQISTEDFDVSNLR